ncbi:cardiolipin synthase [Bacillus sp. Marseille-Q3570]|uniref:cardiolipin synthase n=1 Tax=Bacillus sp. Marseille-Q3570 TaxID=2963522 RepID=UPI0021B72D07|nr:cardiolipin synthase [Bacillus sp. Marseille-Q3570]
MFMTIVVIIALLILWGSIDFYLGWKKHSKETNQLYLPPERGKAELISEGVPFFSKLFSDLKEAESFIYVQFYIIRNDPLGQELFQILKKKASDGVAVYLVFDAIGSYQLPKKTLENLKTCGIRILQTEPPRFPFLFYTFNRRNHRKITVVDGTIAYIGGYNIGEEYIGKNPKLGHWRDYHLRLTGKVVEQFVKLIQWDWKESTGESLEITPLTSENTGDEAFALLATNGEHMEQFFLNKIEEAEKSIFIGSPYFIPGKRLVQALKKASKKGVRVTILIPMRSDHAFVKEAAIPYLLPLLAAGVEVYRYYPGFYHSKVFLIDRKFCDLGTANFDKRSFYLNNEVNCLFTSTSLIQKIEKVLEFDLQQSERLTLPDLRKRSILEKGKGFLALSISRFL